MKLFYQLNDNKDGLVITSCYNLEGKIRIPSECEYKGKTFPVTQIDEYAFWGCEPLTSIHIPDSVTKIGNGAFESCSGLTFITVDKGNQYYDSRENCNAIIESKTNTLVGGCTTTIIPGSVTKIGESAFASLETLAFIYIPDSVIEIGKCAFSRCTKLTSIVIPNSVTKIGNDAFYHCSSLQKIVISDASLLKRAGVPEGVEIVKP